jgi:NADP-dependent aldehyde dehydrogenase
VEVCPSVVHGGPFPATTDNRFTAVGLNAVKRWVRPVCFQNCPESFLPEELKNKNEKGMWRLVNNQWTKDSI